MDAEFRPRILAEISKKIMENAVKDFSPALKIMSLITDS
jgi:hypothetical protein